MPEVSICRPVLRGFRDWDDPRRVSLLIDTGKGGEKAQRDKPG